MTRFGPVPLMVVGARRKHDVRTYGKRLTRVIVSAFTYIGRSSGTTREVTRIALEAARRGLEQFADNEAELAELLTVGDHAIAAEFEFCPACRAFEQSADVERDNALSDSRDTLQSYDNGLPDSDFYRE